MVIPDLLPAALYALLLETMPPPDGFDIADKVKANYFARPGDSADYGTDLYRVENDRQAPFMKTFYPESCGGRAELARSVPFIGNAALIFLNASGMAHGASIPPDATQATRYAYQFYIGPLKSDLARLVLRMPVDQQAAWGRSVASAADDGY